MELEFAIGGAEDRTASTRSRSTPVDCDPRGPLVLDWRPASRAVIDDARAGEPRQLISARFHNALAEMIVDVAKRGGREAWC